jgi:hypothetical protein
MQVAASVLQNRYVMIFGGFGNGVNVFLNTLEIWDSTTQAFLPPVTMTVKRAGAMVLAIGNWVLYMRIYVASEYHIY